MNNVQLTYKQLYRIQNRDKINAYKREYRKKHKETILRKEKGIPEHFIIIVQGPFYIPDD